MSNSIMKKFLPIPKAKNSYIPLPINITSKQLSQCPEPCSNLRKTGNFSYNKMQRCNTNNGSRGRWWHPFIYLFFFFFQPTPFGILGSLYIQRCILNNTGKKGEKSTWQKFSHGGCHPLFDGYNQEHDSSLATRCILFTATSTTALHKMQCGHSV